MNKLFGKGKVLITYVSVLAILAASVLSVFAGTAFNVFAEDGTEGESAEENVVTYPLNGKYDADYTEVPGTGISYEAVDYSIKKDVDTFTGYDFTFCVNPDTEGNGTAKTPYVIKTANQFAAVVTGNLKDNEGNWISTEGICFKIADNIRGFNLKNTDSDVDFSKDNLTAAEVEAALKDKTILSDDVKWENKSGKPFMGRFDGNGACVYGLKANAGYSAIFPKVGGNLTVKNLTVKNCYFEGTNVSAFFGSNSNPGKSSTFNTKLTMFNCQAYGNVLICTFNTDEAIQKCGVFIGQTEWPTEACLIVNDCLVYDNIAKHQTRAITYGLVGNLHRTGSLNINNSIVMDSAPYALYYGSNAHLTSSYNSLYTNMIKKWENVDVKKNNDTVKYVYDYILNGTTLTVQFDHYDSEGNNLTNNGNGYERVINGSVIYNKSADDVKSAATLEGISAEKWSYNANGYPTPKVYKIREYSAGTTWSGEQAVQFGEGDGTKTSPYTVATAEELALMLTKPETGAYYKLTADIAINDTTAENWTENAKTWFTSNDVPTFNASLDGNGYTVSGIYYDGTQEGEYAGLIPVVGDTAEIRSLIIDNSIIKANKGAAGGIAGTIADKCSKVIKFDACVIEEGLKFEGDAEFGGIVGVVGYSKAQITDCLSKSTGFFSRVIGEAKVRRSISVGAYPFASTTDVRPEGVYTDTAGAEIEGVYVVEREQMLGAKAKASMPELNFPTSWSVVTGDYPKATGAAASSEGVVGEPWTGAIATSFASGSGTKDDPYMIETAEQLAYFVYNGLKPTNNSYADYYLGTDANGNKMYSEECPYYTPGHSQQGQLKYDCDPQIHQNAIKYVKLGADIYLNDLDSKLWADKIGCNDWFTQRTTKVYNNISHVNFDGDGYVIYGLFLDTSLSTGEYVRAGLFPMLGAYSTVQNVGVAHAYLNGRTGPENQTKAPDCIGTFMGNCEDFDKYLALDSHDAPSNYEKLKDPAYDYENMAIKFKNCFVDHNSYVSAYYTGGYVGSPYSAVIMENCLYTGTIVGHEDPYYTGALTGCDSTYGTQLRGCVVFPTTDKVSIAGGSHGATWRSQEMYQTVYAEPLYYFNLKQQYGGKYTKLTKPQDRFGEAAKAAMPLLYWSTEDDDYEGWTVVEDSVPLPSIFKKHRNEEELKALSTSKFNTPKVTVSFVTEDPDIVVPDMQGEMYSKDGFNLPYLERPGFEFTGWYVFSDMSIEYPYDYFPPRDLILYAGWKQMGITQNFENYTDSIWDYDEDYWVLNKPGAKGGYKNKYVRNGSKSIHLLGNKPEAADCLLNYEEMLVPGTAYTISFYATTDKENNPPALLSLVHNNYPDYLDTGIALENMAVVTGLKDGEWTKYSYSFTAKTQWISIRGTGNSSIYIDDIVVASLDGVLSDGKVISLSNGSTLSPGTADGVSISVLICALMACAAVAVISRKNLTEVIEG